METSLLVDFFIIIIFFCYVSSFLGICMFGPSQQLLSDKTQLEGSSLQCWQRGGSCSPCFASLSETLRNTTTCRTWGILVSISYFSKLLCSAGLAFSGKPESPLRATREQTGTSKRCWSCCCCWEWGHCFAEDSQQVLPFQMETQSRWQPIIALKFIGPISTTFALDTYLGTIHGNIKGGPWPDKAEVHALLFSCKKPSETVGEIKHKCLRRRGLNVLLALGDVLCWLLDRKILRQELICLQLWLSTQT